MEKRDGDEENEGGSPYYPEILVCNILPCSLALPNFSYVHVRITLT